VRAFTNVLANWAAFIVGTAITFVLSPFVVRHLGDTGYGILGLIGAVVGYLGLLDLGIRVAVTRFVAYHAAKDEHQAINRVISTALGLFLGGGLLASLLGLVVGIALPRFTELPAAYVDDARIACALGGVTVALSLIGGVYGGVLAGLQRLALLNAIDLGTEVLRAGAVVVALSTGNGLVALIVIQLVVVALRGVAYRIAARRLQPRLRAARADFDIGKLREIVRFSTYTMILHVSAVFIFSSDAVVIAAVMPVAQVTFFVIAGNLIQAVFRVLGGVSQALYPLVSARQATDGTLATARLLRGSMRLGALAILPIVVTFLVRGPTFIGLWMGASYAEPSGEILRILALGLCFFASYQMLTQTMMALNRHRGLVPIFVGEAIANVVLSVALGLSFGLPGVAWGTTVPRLFVSLVVGPWYARRELHVQLPDFAAHAWLRPLAAMIPFALVSGLVDAAWPAASLGLFFFQIALLLPLAGAGAWIIGLQPEERAFLRDGMRRVLRLRPLEARL
jgi:O-antigen/teichoic acid export membrane protein